jgi:cysteine dioxygenase
MSLLINTIEDLVDCFNQVDKNEKIQALKCIDIPNEFFESYATWEAGGYTRNCLFRNDEFEFILLCWDKGVKTAYHGHDGQDCWVYQIKGTVREERVKEVGGELAICNELTLDEGNLTYMHDRMGYHALENISEGRAMTLHVYANPIEQCKVYNEDKAKFEIVEMEYDTCPEELYV